MVVVIVIISYCSDEKNEAEEFDQLSSNPEFDPFEVDRALICGVQL